MIAIEHVSKRYGAKQALSQLSFQARQGSITGLLGANGAGKTTLLRIIAGVLKPDLGSVTVDGTLGALLDHTGLYPRLTARENLAYFARLRGTPSSQVQNRIKPLFSLVGLESIADRRTVGFSQGEHMKTALARALIHAPTNLILDEPTNGLDVPTIRSLRALLKRMRDQGACILFSSHVFQEVVGLCDHVVVMSEGSVAGQGTAEELCQQTESATLEEAFLRLTSKLGAYAC